ncbi:MAG: hypothetical protein RJA34_3017 [Pseudomonadota bacterium]|jgi:hypothetical protein
MHQCLDPSFPFFPESIVTTSPAKKNTDIQQLDALTLGAFSAPTSGERASRVREWLATDPAEDILHEVARELAARDKGAAKPLREKLDELKRARNQELLVADWSAKGESMLLAAKLNIADAMAWQRDAAKAGAPLSREPLAGLKIKLAERVRVIEDLQHRVQVQREAAVLLAQRIEVLSTKPWRDAQNVLDSLRADVEHWQAQAAALATDENWASVDLKFPPLLDASKAQLLVVWDAFEQALAQAVAAVSDVAAPLPTVPVWADELRAARGGAMEAPAPSGKPKIDPELRAKIAASVNEAIGKLQHEVANGHGKASAAAAAALRQLLKQHGRALDEQLELQANAALHSAGELEGWQRWRADQLREELVIKAEGLLKRPDSHALGGRKMQETLRLMRDQWKQTDQGGVPNQALWKRFDEACNEAHKVVEAWLDKVKAESAEHKAQRLALIEELKAWAGANLTALDDDWKGFNRILHQFSDRWRDAGHVGEKVFAELQPMWKAAFDAATAPLEAQQKLSLSRRHAMIEEAKELGAAAVLRLDAVKSLQQRWQAEAQAVPVDRRQEQKLWDAFRKPIDEAFQRKSQVRNAADAALSARDRAVLEAAKALEAANASGDAHVIRSTMAALDAALRGQAQARADQAEASRQESLVHGAAEKSVPLEGSGEVSGAVAGEIGTSAETAEPHAKSPVARKPVVAVRGDDRPGMKKSEPVAPVRGGKPGERRDVAGAGRADGRTGGRRDDARSDSRGERGDRGIHGPRSDAPRLGDTAFRAQREAIEHAQAALRKLAAQAHGEALTQLLAAWEARDPARVPSTQDLGGRVVPAVRGAWVKAVGEPAMKDAEVSILRLEMAAEVPTPAEHLAARRALQLQLLTRRNDPIPAQTWGQDAAHVLEAKYESALARRFLQAVKVLVKQ